jgi:hypothetical protein
MNDFETLSASVNLVSGAVTLKWVLPDVATTVSVIRSDFYNDNESTIATHAGNFPGSTYSDTPATRGQYRYKLVIVRAHDGITLESNSVGASTIAAVVLTRVVSGNTVSLSWIVGSGDVVSSTVQRSIDGGLHWVDIRHINGRLGTTFSETLSGAGSFLYRVEVVLPPASCDAVGQHPIVVSNTVGATSGSVPVVPPVIDLGAASGFAILAGSTVTNTGGTVIAGDLGLSPGTSVTGFPPGSVIGTQHVTDTAAANAQLALTAAYNAAAALPGGIIVAGNIGGQTLAPGVYKSTSSLAVSSGDLTLDGGGNVNASWVFQIASTLNLTPGRKVILAGGAQAKNIFWQVGSSATLDTTTIFKGTIMANQSITINTGATVEGRALASVAAVTLDTDAVTVPV